MVPDLDEDASVLSVEPIREGYVPGSQMRFKRISKPVPKFDFFLSYVPNDRGNVEKVKEVFSQHRKELKFFSSEELMEQDDKSADEERVFNVMKTCARVITFLSPAYLEDDDRVEEYNAAWCLNRQTTSFTRLAPMLCEGISNLPTYMSLIQWVDIRLQDGNTEKLMRNVTLYVVGYVQDSGEESSVIKTRPTKAAEDKKAQESKKADEKFEYDLAVAVLTKFVPGIRLFVDRQELQTGGSWQQKLYHAVESSHMTLALLSQSYFNSKMCNEEFRLSLARHFTDSDFHLIPLQIEELTDVDDRYLSVNNCVLGNQDIRSYVEHLLAPAVKQFLSTGNPDGSVIALNKTVYNLRTLLEDGRCSRLPTLIQNETTSWPNADSQKLLIMCSKDSFDSEIAFRIKMRFVEKFGFDAELNIESKDTAAVLKKLDEADTIVVLMSPNFLKDLDVIEGLQVAINRQRLGEWL
ncbi:hypothetical protein EB796_013356 [Bugula neritina]|uniref:TIR domain-containing protein n=1 Tax=Bugula neritina TaxID=10212 RepID=A0A7J7JRT8_BUGNE|nr:hypothetical protein EB796_013356 [Bugula neritina]